MLTLMPPCSVVTQQIPAGLFLEWNPFEGKSRLDPPDFNGQGFDAIEFFAKKAS
jgi:hypothetical protein